MTVGSATHLSQAALAALLERDAVGVGPLRQYAFERFEALPMPSPETEEWRYTDLRELQLDSFSVLAEEPAAATLDEIKPDILEAAGDVGDRAGLAIQHNSSVVSVHQAAELRSRGVVFGSLDAASPEQLASFMHRAVPVDRSRFTALHGAFRTGGTLIHVPAGVRIAAPIQTLTYVDRDGLVVFPHTVLVADEGAEVTFIDRYVSPSLGSAFSDAVVEIFAGPGSRVRYVNLQEWGRGMTHLSVQRAVVGQGAHVRSLGVAFGADLARAEAESILEADDGLSEMLGVYFGDGDQHIDHRSIQDHIGDRTSSDLLYKGALRDRSRAIYTGTVIVERGAHRCDAYQTNRNILLSETAKAHSVPNLEIISNDPVRCGHAASVGPIDEEALFYMQSRGISYQEAQRLIVTGFFQEVLDRVTIPEVKLSLERAIQAELDEA